MELRIPVRNFSDIARFVSIANDDRNIAYLEAYRINVLVGEELLRIESIELKANGNIVINTKS